MKALALFGVMSSLLIVPVSSHAEGGPGDECVIQAGARNLDVPRINTSNPHTYTITWDAALEEHADKCGRSGEYRLRESKDGGAYTTIYRVRENNYADMKKTLSNKSVGTYRYSVEHCDLDTDYCEVVVGDTISVYDLAGVAAPIAAVSTSSSAIQPYEINATYKGSSAISIPLQAAPGVNGLEPNLSLNYSSSGYRVNREKQTPVGVLSYGWNLSGLSKIHRCAAGKDSGYQILFSYSDQLCLDGEPLVKVSGNMEEVGWFNGDIYRTRREGFARVRVTTRGFEVDKPDGTVMEYGETADSRSALAWSLNKVTDAFGNAMSISYYKDTVAHVNYPKRILYGNNGDARIDFSYVAREDAHPLFIGDDYWQLHSVQLQRVKIYTDGSIQREYRLMSDTTPEGWLRLDKIQQCAYNQSGSGRKCMAPLDISWESTDSSNPEESLMAVSKIHDGIKETRFSYTTITSASSTGTFAERPYGEGAPPGATTEQAPVSGEYRHVLTEIDRDDGIGGRHKTSYAYQGVGLKSTKSWGFLGFYAQREIDKQSGIVTYRQFRQRHPHFTKVARLQQYDGIYGSSEILTDKQYRYGEVSLSHPAVPYDLHTYVPMLTESLSTTYEQGVALGGEYTQVQYTKNDNALARRTVTKKMATSVTPGNSENQWGEYSAPSVSGVLRSRQTVEDFTNRIDGDQWLHQFVNRRVQKFYDGDAGASPDRISVVTYSPQSSSNKVASQVSQPGNTDYELTTSYSYTDEGYISSETVSGVGVSSRTTSVISYLDKRYPVSVSNPLGHSVSTVYDTRFGLPEQITDANNRSTSISYDNFGRETSRTTPDGVIFSTSYDRCSSVSCPALAENRIVTSSPVTPTTTRYLDALNRLIRTERSPFSGTDNIVERIVYDGQGRVRKTSNPYFIGDMVSYTRHEYDLYDRVTRTTQPDGSYTKVIYGKDTTQSLGSVKTQDYVYADDGTFVEIQKKLSYYNMAGDLIETYDGYGSSEQVLTEYRYNGSGQLNWSRVNSDSNTVTTVAYDAATGFRDSITSPAFGTVSYAYNALGQKVSQTDNSDQAVSYTYDKLGRLTRQVDPDGIANWVYDPINAKGALASRSYPGFSESYSYNGSAQLTDIDTDISVTSGGEVINKNYNHAYTYDSYGRLDTLTYPTGIRVGYRYTNDSYLQKLVDDRDGRVLKSFADLNAFGAVEQENYGNGLTTNRTYNPLNGQLESIESGNGEVQDSEYRWRSNGTLESRLSRTDDTVKQETFTYDTLNRLNAATTIVDGSSRTLTTLYDKLGNITSKTGAHAGDEAATAIIGDSSTLSYDANGAVTRYDSDSGDDRWIIWNARQLAEEITFGSSKTTSTPTARDRFRYGPDGQRFFREATWMEGGTLRTERTFYVGKFEELIPANDPDYSSVATANIDSNVVHVKATEILGPDLEFMEYLHRDHLGSIEKITDETGALILNTPFEPFGTRRAKDWRSQILLAELNDLFASQNLTTRRGFTDHEHLDRTGFIHMDGRVYDPTLSRFISPDPLVQAPTNSQSWNRYSYVFNSPLSFTDPSGYAACQDVWVPAGKENDHGGESGTLCHQEPVFLTAFERCNAIHERWICGALYAGDKEQRKKKDRQEAEAAHYAEDGRLAKARALTDPFVRGYNPDDPSFHQYEIGPSFGCLEGNGCSTESVAPIVDSEAVPFKLIPPGSGETTLLGTNPINHYSVGNFSVNDTISDHWFHPGTVVHVTFQSDGAVWFYTRGVGTGQDQFWNKAIGYGAFGKMHSDVRNRINMEILGLPPY